MTLLLLLRPRHDCHDPGVDIDNIKRIRRRLLKGYEKKAKRKKPEKLEEADKQATKPAKEERDVDSEVRYFETALQAILPLRDRLIGIRDALNEEAYRKRIRRLALRELAIREYLAELRQEEEDHAIMLMLWELVN